MTARIYKPAKTAMQSGTARTKEWALDFAPEQPREIEPLMGWTSSADMNQQIRLRFDTAEEAVAYCEGHGIAYQVFAPKRTAARPALDFAAPPGVVEVKVDPTTGFKATPYCPVTMTGVYPSQMAPTADCPYHTSAAALAGSDHKIPEEPNPVADPND